MINTELKNTIEQHIHKFIDVQLPNEIQNDKYAYSEIWVEFCDMLYKRKFISQIEYTEYFNALPAACIDIYLKLNAEKRKELNDCPECSAVAILDFICPKCTFKNK